MEATIMHIDLWVILRDGKLFMFEREEDAAKATMRPGDKLVKVSGSYEA